MKSENDLNQKISKELKKRRGLHYLKASDKISVGVPDFLLWFKSKSAGFETKFVRDWGTESSNLLKHTFTGAQQTWLESLEISGNSGYGGVYVHCEGLLYIVHCLEIPTSGNWKTHEFKEGKFPAYPKQEWSGKLVEHILGTL